jgi:long-chain acyl-CoA synthetase
MNVTAALSRHALARPDQAALVVDDTVLTYGELEAALGRLGAALRLRGQTLALHLGNGLPLALLALAGTRAGLEVQILDPSWPEPVLASVLEGLAPDLTITGGRHLQAGDRVLWMDPDAPLAVLLDALQAPAAPEPAVEVAADRPFYVGFTSGSTGAPKGYRRGHQSWLESFRADATEFGLTSSDVVAAPGTLTHSLFLYALMNGLHAGASVLLARSFRPPQVLALMTRHGATVLYGVPTQIALLIEAARTGGGLRSLRWVLSSGAKWVAEAVPDLDVLAPEARFAEFYGASELSFVTVAKHGEALPEGSVGRAFRGVTITIRDRSGRVLPARRRGLVFVESPMVFTCYAHGGEGGAMREGTALSVGDVGYLDEGGFLHLVGRANRMIVSSGRNIHPEEIERVLEGHPAVDSASVMGAPDGRRGERLTALVGLSREGVDRAELIAHARRALPLFKVPRLYGRVRDWPLTRSGKSDHEALRRIWDEGRYEALT